jgi:hypothetical protein
MSCWGGGGWRLMSASSALLEVLGEGSRLHQGGLHWTSCRPRRNPFKNNVIPVQVVTNEIKNQISEAVLHKREISNAGR